ncbi:MAG: hypothetical protein KA754_05070 [Corallincola sp.]|nr:hypothetical protein [Corallincola sp.]
MFEICHQHSVSGRAFFVGDLLGRANWLLENLRQLQFDGAQGDMLFCTGNLIGTDGQSLELLKLLDEPWFFSVAGDNEAQALKARQQGWRKCADGQQALGGHWLKGLNAAQQADAIARLPDLPKLPLLIEVVLPDHKRIAVAHATLPFANWSASLEAFAEEPRLHEETVLSDLTLWWQVRTAESGVSGNINWSPLFTGIDAVVIGHHATPRGMPLAYSNGVWLNTLSAKGLGSPCILSSDDLLALGNPALKQRCMSRIQSARRQLPSSPGS